MDILKIFEVKTDEALKHLKDQLSGIRGSRLTSKLVEDIPVEYFG
ncbi:ribosome recycling factor, partial [Candidatus Wolfebacteria bacterium]|nr:ribosome recycling factor [Candidatus Wolfebacteria bacterium]